MAAFAFVLSLDGIPLNMPGTTRQRVFSALQERSPGPVQVEESRHMWAALSGPQGGLILSGTRLLLCDGVPETQGGTGGRRLLDELAREGTTPRDLESEKNLDEQVGILQTVLGSFAACYCEIGTRNVWLMRDRIGTRPLFFAEMEGRVLVASECKALQALGLPLHIDPNALREALIYRWVTGASCLLAPAVRVPEASIVHIGWGQAARTRRYWRLQVNPEPPNDHAFARYQDEVDEALRASLRRLNAGSPKVGILLSGGVDSSILAALAKEEYGSCVAFAGRIPGFDNVEFDRAKKVAAHLGAEFRGVEIDIGKLPHDLPYIVRRLEEPPRHLNDLVLLQLLRQAGTEVDVVLQGDAADTLFGLNTKRHLRNFIRKRKKLTRLPEWILRLGAGLLERVPLDRAWEVARVLAWDESRWVRHKDAIGYTARVRNALGVSLLDLPAWESGDWHPQAYLDGTRRVHLLSSGIEGSLIRHDRLSRPEGIESLAPFLSPEVVGVASRIPRELCEGDTTKPVLRALSDRYLPPEVSRQSKIGFDTPSHDWLFGILRPLCEEAEQSLADTDLLPGGFYQTALNVQDKEGVLSGVSMYLLMKEFGLSQPKP